MLQLNVCNGYYLYCLYKSLFLQSAVTKIFWHTLGKQVIISNIVIKKQQIVQKLLGK